jgi:hypothetical protein
MGWFKKRKRKSWEEIMEGWHGDDTGTWHTADAIWTSDSGRIYRVPYNSPKPVDPIESAADDVLIFELIKRGYAVAKMPAEELAKEV